MLWMERCLVHMSHAAEIDPHLFCVNETWFHLSEYISSHNNRFWSAENPALIHEMQFSDINTLRTGF